ncbi:hypothetical protein [Gorillibacterium sp. CAU 1737]|uniref:hypothetical protein n=1 Tax=Gorillibacterium sp. CAU 1737 TaxID=3140362 RepID=UPI003261CA8A
MKITLVDGSPKTGISNSSRLLSLLQPLIANDNELTFSRVGRKPVSPAQIEELCTTDALVLAFPLYIDAIPSHLMAVMVEMEAFCKRQPSSSSKKPHVYALVNNGFYEGHQTRIAIEIVKHWCARCGFLFGMAIGYGAGEMLGFMEKVPLGHGPLKNLGNAMNKLASAIQTRESGESLLIQPNFPRIAWKYSAHFGFWNSTAKKNGLKKKDLLRRL